MRSAVLLAPVAVFSLWLLSSFLCHQLGKMALEVYVTNATSSTTIVAAVLVTLFQALCCYACLTNVTASTKGALSYVTAGCHFLAALATNTSLALTFASSTMAVKLLEPVTSAVLQRLLMKKRPPARTAAAAAESVAATLTVVVGIILYVGSPATHDDRGDVTRAVVLAVVSNLAIGVRDATAAVKLPASSHNDSSAATSASSRLRLRPKRTVLTFFAAAACVVCLTHWSEEGGEEEEEEEGGAASWTSSLSAAAAAVAALTPRQATYFLLLSLASGVCQVTHAFVSTHVVPRYVSVVAAGGQPLVDVFQRLLVVLLLHVAGRRSSAAAAASLCNWAGLALCAGGLLLYGRRAIITSSSGSSSSSPLRSVTSEEALLGDGDGGGGGGGEKGVYVYLIQRVYCDL